MRRSRKWTMVLIAAVLVGAGAFLLGRFTAPAGSQHATLDDYLAGLRAGEAQGRMDGRAVQEGIALPRRDRAPVHDAFEAGYVAGMNDVFAGYDGGWALHVPWIVTLEAGSGQVVYRIRDRTQLEPGVDYFLCPDGHSLCHRRR